MDRHLRNSIFIYTVACALAFSTKANAYYEDSSRPLSEEQMYAPGYGPNGKKPVAQQRPAAKPKPVAKPAPVVKPATVKPVEQAKPVARPQQAEQVEQAAQKPAVTPPGADSPVDTNESVFNRVVVVDGQTMKLVEAFELSGVNSAALNKTLQFYEANKKTIKNKKYVTLIDYSKSARQQRLYVFNMETGAHWKMHTTHGSGSDRDGDGIATNFSNVSGSNATSLGFFVTGNTYMSTAGQSAVINSKGQVVRVAAKARPAMRMIGLSPTNSNALSRAIVMHGAWYINPEKGIFGRSQGCPAVTNENMDRLIQILPGGSLMYSFK